ncbi:baseplate J/gp47 family protein [Rhodocyclus gracilis]|uniref:Baseplate J protein n=1 Tax=Rhodocyclus tenuis TaxID=1066 RepID=A0A6L5JSS0_RHOTE|nr:baseplate J/gp47 family protein [Rhodocyclus gracilis]MQY50186.1 baseplate J protein [Rhodocyclus gracilis]
MPFVRPDLPTLIERAVADIESRFPGADARLRRSNLTVLSRVHAGAVHGLYGYLDWIARQILVDKCDDDVLERHAAIWLKSGRVSAFYAAGAATVTGSNGTVIEAGAVFRRQDGAAFVTKGETTVIGGTAVLALEASEPGQAGNTPAGSPLGIESPIDGLNATATVGIDGLSGGADIEDIESLRARVLARIQQTPHGGAAHDYVAWALEVPGVTRAWCYPLEMGDGTVTVRFVRDNDASLIPDAAEVAAVQAYIDAQRPIGMELFVVAPIAAPLAFQIQLTPATASVKAAVEASLRDLLIREAEPEGGGNEGKIPLSHIREAISLAAGETDHVLLSPVADITLSVGQIATFGGIAWV